MDKMNADGVFHKDKIALVLDHFVPNKDIKSAEHCKCVREFAYRNEITNYFEVGEMGSFVNGICFGGMFFHIGFGQFIHRENSVFTACFYGHIGDGKTVIHG